MGSRYVKSAFILALSIIVAFHFIQGELALKLNVDHLNRLRRGDVWIPIGDTRLNVVRIAYDFPLGINILFRIVRIRNVRIP